MADEQLTVPISELQAAPEPTVTVPVSTLQGTSAPKDTKSGPLTVPLDALTPPKAPTLTVPLGELQPPTAQPTAVSAAAPRGATPPAQKSLWQRLGEVGDTESGFSDIASRAATAILKSPVTGATQAIKGVGEFVKSLPIQPPPEVQAFRAMHGQALDALKPADWEGVKAGVSDILEGVGTAATIPTLAYGAVNPYGVITGIAKTWVAGKTGQQVAKLLGGSESTQRFMEDATAGATALGLTAQEVGRLTGEQLADLRDHGAAVRAAADADAAAKNQGFENAKPTPGVRTDRALPSNTPLPPSTADVAPRGPQAPPSTAPLALSPEAQKQAVTVLQDETASVDAKQTALVALRRSGMNDAAIAQAVQVPAITAPLAPPQAVTPAVSTTTATAKAEPAAPISEEETGKPALAEQEALPTLPRELAGAKPRYNIGQVAYEPQFESDVDKAAYITAQTTPSARDADYLDFVMDETGYDETKARAYGRLVKAHVSTLAKQQDEPGELDVPTLLQAAGMKKQTEEAAAPTATFLGYSDPRGEENGVAQPLYNISGGPKDRSTVSGTTELEKAGVSEVPKTPTFDEWKATRNAPQAPVSKNTNSGVPGPVSTPKEGQTTVSSTSETPEAQAERRELLAQIVQARQEHLTNLIAAKAPTEKIEASRSALQQARANLAAVPAARNPVTPQVPVKKAEVGAYDRDAAQATFKKFRTALTKAKNAAKKDGLTPDQKLEKLKAIVAEAKRFNDYYENSAEPWPDYHHDWVRAGEDAEHAIKRLEPSTVGKALTSDRNAVLPNVPESKEEKTPAQNASPSGIAPGMIRMYHGGADSGNKSTSLWFTSDRARADYYAKKSSGNVSYVDIPEDHPNIAAEYPEQTIANGFHRDVELPPDIAAKRQPVEERASTKKLSEYKAGEEVLYTNAKGEEHRGTVLDPPIGKVGEEPRLRVDSQEETAHGAAFDRMYLREGDVRPAEKAHDYSSTQINLDGELKKQVLALGRKIPTPDLMPAGLDTEPHVTVKYGLHADGREAIAEKLKDAHPFDITLGDAGFFPDSGHGDVLYITIESPELHALNAKVAELPHTDTHPGYQPHLTIAYLKPGKGKVYAAKQLFNTLKGKTFHVGAIQTSLSTGKVWSTPLLDQEVRDLLADKKAPVTEEPEPEAQELPEVTEGRKVEEAEDEGPSRITGASTTEAPERPAPSGEGSAARPEREPGERPAAPKRGAGTGTHPARPEPGEGEGTGAGGSVPEHAGPVGGGRKVRAKSVARANTESSLSPDLYQITDADAIGSGSKRERVQRNMAAIRILRQLTAEDRLATVDERKALVRYVGWGGLPRIFEYWKNDPDDPDTDSQWWNEQGQALRELLTDEEFAAGRNSTQNAHYTSPVVIRAMWEAAKQLGVKGGSALEPAAGIGHFIGLAPDDLRSMAFATVEKDTISAAITKALYPGAYNQHAGFEDATLPDDHFTLAISNVPFGLIPITDRAWSGPAFVPRRIHNYFFGKALTKVAPGGLVAFITSHGTMDARDETGQRVREYLGAKADFLGAIRLPFTAFKGNAGTEVVTDIIFLRRRFPEEKAAHVAPWLESKEIQLPAKNGDEIKQRSNEYFIDHPEMVLGTPASTGKMRGKAEHHTDGGQHYNVEPLKGRELGEQLSEAIKRLPMNAIDTTLSTESLESFVETQAPLGSRPFEYLMHDGQLAQNIDGRAVQVEMSKADEARVRGMLPIRTAVRDLYDLMAADAGDEEIEKAQKTLNTTYDKFVKVHGPISSSENFEAFHEDPDLPILLSLEDYDDERGIATKNAVFTQRTMRAERRLRTASSPDQALSISLGETGKIDLDRIGELLGQGPEQAADTLQAANLIVDTPSGWQLPVTYLAGNVRVKHAEAAAAALMNPKYQDAADKLKAVIPEDRPAHKIRVRLGAAWVPVPMVKEFIDHIVGGRGASEWTIGYTPADARWDITGSPSAHSSKFQIPDVDTKTILLDAMNDRRRVVKNRVPNPNGEGTVLRVDRKATALARQRKEDVSKAFQDWLLKDDPTRRDWTVRTYNDLFHSYVEPKIDGSYLTFPGMADFWRERMSWWQRNAVSRILLFGNTLLAHVVGAGKTLEMVAAIMELRRSGLARKPMMVVPNHLISQAPSEFLQYYPNAKVLVATSDDLSAEKRKRFTARIAAGSYDAIIAPYSAFVRISMSAEAEMKYQKEMLDEIELAIIKAWAEAEDSSSVKGGRSRRGGKTPPSVKNLENMRDRIEARLKKLAERPKDDMLSFEQLGVDSLFIDEIHSFKGLYFPTRQQAAGIPAQNDVQRAMDLYLKARYINDLSGYRNLVGATGTPITNSMAEVYVMQKLFQEQVLERAQINQFDAWLAQFGKIVAETTLDPSGTGMSARPVLKRFNNLVDLAAMFRQVADVKMIDDLPELKSRRPKLKGGKIEQVQVPMTSRQLGLMAELKSRADNLDPKDRKSDNMPKITTDGRMGMLDMRLLDRLTPEENGNKLSKVAENVASIWKEWKAKKGTQLVFLDSGTPNSEKNSDKMRTEINPDTGEKIKRPPTEAEKNRGFNLYGDLKKKLIKAGVPAEQIAFIHDIDAVPEKKQDAAHKALFRKVREGEIRVLIGSTKKMGTGMNVQDRLVALHHVEPTWTPDGIEQRNGRILRQGNLFFEADPENFEVRILNYLTTGRGNAFGFDAYMWQLNERKAGIISDFFSGDLQDKDYELDLNQTVLTAGEMKAVATGNPRVIEFGRLQGELERLELTKQGFEEAKRESSYMLSAYEESLMRDQRGLERAQATAAVITPATEEPVATFTEGTKSVSVTGYKNIGERIIAVAKAEVTATKAHPGPWKSYVKPKDIGTFRGLQMTLEGNGTTDPWIVLRHPADTPPRYNEDRPDSEYSSVRKNLLMPDPEGPGGQNWRSSPQGMVIQINNDINDLGEQTTQKAYVRHSQERVNGAKAALEGKFDQQEELTTLRFKVEELAKELGLPLDNMGAEVSQDELDIEGGDGGEGGDDEPKGKTKTQTHEMRSDDEESVDRALTSADETIRNASEAIKTTLVQGPTKEDLVRHGMRTWRQRIGEIAQRHKHATFALNKMVGAFDRLAAGADGDPKDPRVQAVRERLLKIADAIEDPEETGERVPENLQAWADIRNELFELEKSKQDALGIGLAWRDYYLGHIWQQEDGKKPSTVKRMMAWMLGGKRPIEGPKSYRKRRSIPTMREGVEQWGKEPEDWNLVRIDLAKLQEMRKFTAATTWLMRDLKPSGAAKFVSALGKPPEGMRVLPGRFFEVWAPPTVEVREAFDYALMHGLESIMDQMGIPYTRIPDSKKAWGTTEIDQNTGEIRINAKFGGPVEVLQHELGHALDERYKMADLFPDAEYGQELADLARLRHEGVDPSDKFKDYVQGKPEQMANLVHAYLHAPEELKRVAPKTNDRLREFIESVPELDESLPDLQNLRSLVLGERATEKRLPGPVLVGRYYAPQALAKAAERYLQPGMGTHPAWRLITWPANALVQWTLAWPLFHFYTVTKAAMADEGAQGLQSLMAGHPLRGLQQIAQTPFGPLLAGIAGQKAVDVYRDSPDAMAGAVLDEVQMLIMGGGRPFRSPEYSNHQIQAVKRNIQTAHGAWEAQLPKTAAGAAIKAAFHLVPAALEAAAWIVMDKYVPMIKTGSILRGIQTDLANLPGTPTPETIRAIATKRVNQADALYGQVIWDNMALHVNRAMMNAMQLMIMAPGWRGGALVTALRAFADPLWRLKKGSAPFTREKYTLKGGGAGGGKGTPPKGPGAGAEKEPLGEDGLPPYVHEPWFSSYLALFIMIGVVGAAWAELWQLAHGAGHIQSPKDVAAPRDGTKDADGKDHRDRFPGYEAIYYEMLRHTPFSILQYALGGESPLPRMVTEWYHNENAFGGPIWDPGDTFGNQLAQYARYVKAEYGKTITQSSYARAETPEQKRNAIVFASSPASKAITDTPAEALMRQYAPPRKLTQDDEDKLQLKRYVRAGSPEEADAAISSGDLSVQEITKAMESGALGTSADEVRFTQLPYDKALKVYGAASPEERGVFFPILFDRLDTAVENASPNDAKRFVDGFNAALALPVKAQPRKAQ